MGWIMAGSGGGNPTERERQIEEAEQLVRDCQRRLKKAENDLVGLKQKFDIKDFCAKEIEDYPIDYEEREVFFSYKAEEARKWINEDDPDFPKMSDYEGEIVDIYTFLWITRGKKIGTGHSYKRSLL